MDAFSFCLNGLSLVGQGVIHVLFVSRLTGRRLRGWHLAAYILPLGAMEWAAAAYGLPYMLAAAAELLLLYALSRCVLKNRRWPSWVAAVTALYIAQLSFGMVNSVEAALLPRLIGRPLLYPMVMLAALAALALCAGCCAAVERLLSLTEEEQVPYVGLLLVPGLFSFAVELYILRTAYSAAAAVQPPAEAGRHAALLILQALGLGALLCTLYAYRCIRQSFQTYAGLLSLLQAARTQRAYVAEAEARYARTAAFRHDIKNHLRVLRGLLDSGRTEEGRDYLQKIEAVSAALSLPCQTGNPVVDILLGEKLKLAEVRGIRTEVSLRLPAHCGADSFDLCVIFANAMDNALNACRPGEGEIRVSGERQGDFCSLSFENTCLPGPPAPMGTGLSNIRAVAEKYHGVMRTERSGRRFRLDVLLNISLPAGDSAEQDS